MESTGVERDLVRNFITSRMETGSLTRDGGNELLALLGGAGNEPILPTTPPPKPPGGRAEEQAVFHLRGAADLCRSDGVLDARIGELMAYLLAQPR
jgi:hypothetical protein